MAAGFFGKHFRRKDRDASGEEDAQESMASYEAEQDPAASPATGETEPDFHSETENDGHYHIKPVLGSTDPFAASRNEEPERPQAESSPFDGLMHDQVLMTLVQEGVVTLPQALTAVREQKRRPGETLWRLLTTLPGVDQDAVFAEAARINGFETAHISVKKPSDELIEAVLGLFPAAAGQEMLRLGLLPYEFVMDQAARRHSLVLATHDPSSKAVTDFVKKLAIHTELRYAPRAAVADCLRRKRAAARTEGVATEEERYAEADITPTNPDVDYRSILPNGLTYDDVARLMQADSAAEVMIESRHDHTDGGSISGSDDLDLNVNAPTDDDANRSFDGASNKHGGNAPALKLTEWTGDASNEGSSNSTPEERSAQDAAIEAVKAKDRVIAMLLKKEIVTVADVVEAQQRQKRERSREALWRILAHSSKVDREAIFAEAARVYAFPVARLGSGQPDAEFARSVMDTFSEERREELMKLRVLPFECDLEHQTGAIKLVFITHDPTRPEVHRLMQQLKLERFELRYAPEGLVTSALAEAYPRKNEFLERMGGGERAFDLGANYDEKGGLIDESALEAEISRSTLINLFEATLVEAVRQGSSDIHIYPNADKKIEIHFRVDGRLNLWHLEDKVHPEAFLAVIKDNSVNVDRFERDAAQDGFIQRWIDEALIRFRVSVLPIANASQELRSESIVIRVLDDRKVITDLRKLGLLENAYQRFNQAIRQPHGMVILTGPTGSGKSTTLVAALHQVVTPEVNVLTVEDPVEYIIPGVRQIKLNHKLGLEDALRSILRHDPDVVMVGEMRDRQTAELAIKLANTGHLTFSTLHTNDAAAAVSRLYKMGIEPFLIAYAINLVVAQRLIRTLCPACKVKDDDPDTVMLNKLGFTDEEIANTPIYGPSHDQSCKVCKGTGYKGRRAVSEALYFSRNIRHMIVEADKAIDEQAIRDLAVKEGMLTLADSAREFVKLGETSIMEMVRVVTTES